MRSTLRNDPLVRALHVAGVQAEGTGPWSRFQIGGDPGPGLHNSHCVSSRGPEY